MPLLRALSLASVLAMLPIVTGAFAHDITGIVVDINGKPVANADVWLSQDRVAQTGKTDAAGQFEFTDLRTGSVDIIAREEGMALGGVQGQIIRNTDVTITLGKAETLRLRMIDTSFEPIEGARVRKLSIHDTVQIYPQDLIPLGFPSVRSDADGFLNIPDLPQGSFVSIIVSHRAFAEASLPSLPTGIELDLSMVYGVKLRGRVTNESAEGVAGAHVSVFRTGAGGDYEFAQVSTDREGFYTAVAPPEVYRVAARHPDYAMPKPETVELTQSGPDAIQDMVLPTAHRITGKAVDMEGRPVPLLRLDYRRDDVIFEEVVSDARGEFELRVAVGDGAVHFTPPERMMVDGLQFVRVRVGEQPVVEIPTVKLRPLPEIRGRVTSREPVPLRNIVISSLNLDPPVYTTTNATGNFSIQLDRMHEETLRFRAEHTAYFFRDDFKVDPVKLDPVRVSIRPFKPELNLTDQPSMNNLDAMVGKPAPEIQCDAWFNLEEDKETLTLEELRGKVVVLTLWAGFDLNGLSGHRMRELNAIYDAMEGMDDVVFIGVHDASVEPFEVAGSIRELGIRFPVGCDADPFQTFDTYKASYIPQTVLIDKQGVLRHYKVDMHLSELIKDLRRR